jgi:hypothetical protein
MKNVGQVLSVAMILALGCDGAPAPTDGGPIDEACATDADCDDGRFCNGPEMCMPESDAADVRGCVSTPPCMESQRCLEDEDRCVTSCAVAPDADGDGADALGCGGIDCDDADSDRFPGNTEVCDAADHDEDCDPATFGERDGDGDSYVDAVCCNEDESGRRFCGDDCNDFRRDAHLGASEVCEGFDNDCDGLVDEGLLVRHYRDSDFDLHGSSGESMEVCPGTPGWSLASDDCDDSSPVRHGAQLEICDSIDNDCDGTVDEAPVAIAWYPDEDGDLFGAPPTDDMDVVISCVPVEGRSTRSSDCNDADASIHPGAREVCNGADDDCNGRADAQGTRVGDTEDDDRDLVADVVCGGSDCDDSNEAVSPDALEICNGLDDDCDGVVDGDDAMALWYLDRDRDGWGDASSPPIEACLPQAMRITRGGDCDDGDASVHPRAPDYCDGVDADCDASIDENGVRFAFFPDADGDGWGDTELTSVVYACTAPDGTVDRTGDCSDTDPTRYPTALEECDTLDNDCDARIDEAADRMWYLDADGDGHGVGTGLIACMRPAGRAPLGDDCDDTNANNFPGNTEACNGRDDDCDGTADDGATAFCGMLPNAMASLCTAGACAVDCDAGYGDCDGMPENGCETNTNRSPTHCGACGDACGFADSCGLGTPGVCDQSRIVMITGGEDGGGAGTLMVVRESGGVATWGAGTDQRNTFAISVASPRTTALTGIAEVHIGQELACARTSGRRVLCWGQNDVGGCGTGMTTSQTLGPGEVILIDDAVALDVGLQHACAVRAGGDTDPGTGTVWCWGWRSNGQTGNGVGAAGTSAQVQPTPAVVAGIDDAFDVYAGARHTCAMRGPAGSRYVSCWGLNDSGQLGEGTTTGLGGAASRVVGLPGDLVTFAHGHSSNGTCVVTASQTAFCWGDNSILQLGVGSGSSVLTAVQQPQPNGIVEISMGLNGGCSRTAGGHVWCWGSVPGTSTWIDGVTGNASSPRRAGPVAMPITDAIGISMTSYRWCAALGDGSVQCMGSDGSGGLGNGLPVDSHSYTAPIMVPGFP